MFPTAPRARAGGAASRRGAPPSRARSSRGAAGLDRRAGQRAVLAGARAPSAELRLPGSAPASAARAGGPCTWSPTSRRRHLSRERRAHRSRRTSRSRRVSPTPTCGWCRWPRTQAARASATSPARATRCRRPCAASATTSRCWATPIWTRGPGALARFDAIVTGVRAFNVNERLRAAHAALMEYVAGGGTLVVQYNTHNRLASLPTPLGPLPFDIGQRARHRRDGRRHVARAEHPAVTSPNRLRRGRLRRLGAGARALLRRHAGTRTTRRRSRCTTPARRRCAGSLLWARHGKGTFVYTGLAFFRQLPAGVPGAYPAVRQPAGRRQSARMADDRAPTSARRPF